MTEQEKAQLLDIIIDLRKATDLDELPMRKEVIRQIDRLYELIE